MRGDGFAGSVETIRRKLRALAAVAGDSAVTEHERANAEALSARLKQQLRDAGVPAGDWTDGLLRLGRRVKTIKGSAAPASPAGNWTDHAFRLGRALRMICRTLQR
jgi:hypothetical protein